MIMSAKRASSRPPPTAAPFTAAITGFSQSIRARAQACADRMRARQVPCGPPAPSSPDITPGAERLARAGAHNRATAASASSGSLHSPQAPPQRPQTGRSSRSDRLVADSQRHQRAPPHGSWNCMSPIGMWRSPGAEPPWRAEVDPRQPFRLAAGTGGT